MVHTHRAHHLDQLPVSELQHANNETKIKSAKSDFNEQVLSSRDGRPFDHNRHGTKRGRVAVPVSGGELGPHVTQCRLGRGLSRYQVAS